MFLVASSLDSVVYPRSFLGDTCLLLIVGSLVALLVEVDSDDKLGLLQ